MKMGITALAHIEDILSEDETILLMSNIYFEGRDYQSNTVFYRVLQYLFIALILLLD